MRKEKIRIKKSRYALTLFFVILIFAAGVLIGMLLSQSRIDYLENEVFEHRLNFQSLQLQSLFLTSLINQNKTENCQALYYFLEQNLYSVGQAQEKVDKYARESDEKVFYNYKREYNQAQINYWLMYKQVKQICEPNQAAILWFYSNTNCLNCKAQGTVLDYLKSQFSQDLLIFSIDADLISEPMVVMLKKSYNVEELPTLVVEDNIYHEFTGKEELIRDICNVIEHDYCGTENP